MRAIIAPGLLALFPATATAGVLLTEDASLPDAPREEAWVVDLPFDNQWERFELPGDVEPAAKPATSRRGAARRRGAASSTGGLLAGAADSGLDDARSLQELLRAYINVGHRAVAGDVPNRPEARGPAPGDVSPASSPDFTLLPPKMIQGAFVHVIDLALASSVNNAGLTTISLFGFGEFALTAAGDTSTIAIAFGDSLLLSLPVFRDDGPALAQGGAGASLADPSAAGMAAIGAMTSVVTAADAVGGEGASGIPGTAADVGGAERRSPVNRMLGLLYEILTYPATALIVVAVFGLQLLRSRGEGNSRSARGGVHGRGHRRRKRVSI
jgi:hypothetical protein